MSEQDWHRHGACRHCAPELFFPIGTTASDVVADIEAAKAICATCPVQPECLRYAVETRQEYGIWGGTTEDERRGLRKAMRAAERRIEVPNREPAPQAAPAL
ncbi:MAG TPA: WhiB family transcriptional regulator [Acidimicrobiales bacterium]|nr:WhiB family transcriptional regulator [Acidimicrobiales bacterium]